MWLHEAQSFNFSKHSFKRYDIKSKLFLFFNAITVKFVLNSSLTLCIVIKISSSERPTFFKKLKETNDKILENIFELINVVYLSNVEAKLSFDSLKNFNTLREKYNFESRYCYIFNKALSIKSKLEKFTNERFNEIKLKQKAVGTDTESLLENPLISIINDINSIKDDIESIRYFHENHNALVFKYIDKIEKLSNKNIFRIERIVDRIKRISTDWGGWVLILLILVYFIKHFFVEKIQILIVSDLKNVFDTLSENFSVDKLILLFKHNLDLFLTLLIFFLGIRLLLILTKIIK